MYVNEILLCINFIDHISVTDKKKKKTLYNNKIQCTYYIYYQASNGVLCKNGIAVIQ